MATAVRVKPSSVSVSPRKSKNGLRAAWRPRTDLRIFTCARSCAPSTRAHCLLARRHAVDRADLLGLRVEGRLQVLEAQAEVEDVEVAHRRAAAGAARAARRAIAAPPSAARAQEVRARAAVERSERLVERLVAVEVGERQVAHWM